MIGLGLGIFKLALSKLSSIAEVIGEYFYDFTQQNIDGFVGGDVNNRIENTSPTKPDFSFGNALKFDGVNDFVSTSNIGASATSLTVSAWVNPVDISSQLTIVGNYSYTPRNAGWLLQISNDDISFFHATSLSDAGNNNTRALNVVTASWQHIMVVYNGGLNSCTIYRDGVDVTTSTTGTIPNSLPNNTANTLIGQFLGLGRFYEGTQDEIAIWVNTIGTSQNAIDLYNSGNGALASSIIPSPTAYWRCNEEDEATTLVDEQGSYNGTLTNFNFDSTDGFVRHGYYKELSPYTGIVGSFNGSNGIDCLDAMTSIKSNSLNTLTVFCRIEVPAAANRYIICMGDRSANTFTAIYLNSSNLLSIISRDTSTVYYSQTTISLTQGDKHDIACVWESGEMPILYLDGSYIGVAITGTPHLVDNNVDSFSIGVQHKSNTKSFGYTKYISDVIAISEVLTPTQIANLSKNPELTKNYLVDTVGITWSDVAAFYPLCEGAGNIAYDMSDNKNHTTWTNPAYETLQSKGRQLGLQNVSRYSTFDGVNDVVNVSTPFTLSQGTIAFWFMPQQNNYNRVIGGDGSNNSYINPQIGSSKVLVRIDNNLNQMYFTDPLPMVQGQWYHIAVTFNSTTANCFVNGIACQENPFEIPAPSNTFQVFNLGRLWQNATYGKQILDDVAVWDVELTQSNIAGIFGGNSASDYSPENLQLYYKDCFINSQGVFKDISGNNNDGIPNGDMETIILPEKETIANIPYDTFGLECNSQRVIINGDTVEETFALRGNGNVRYDGHAGAFVDIKQIQFWFNPLSNTDLNYLMVDENNNAIIKMVGNQISSDAPYTISTVYVNDIETDVILNNVWQQVTIEFALPKNINEFVMGSDYANTPGTFEEFNMDKLNLVEIDLNSFDPDALAIIAQMTTNGSTPSVVRQAIINQLVLDLKGLGNTGSDDVFSRLEYLNVFAAEDETQALTEWITANGTIDAINVNSTAFTVDTGYTGENLRTIRLPKVLNTGTKYLQDSASVGFYGTPADAFTYVMGSNVSPRTYIRTGTAATDQTMNSTAGGNIGFGSIARGLFISNRNNSTQFSTIKNNAIVSTANLNSTGRPSIPQVVFGLATGVTTFIASNASQAEIVFAASAVDDVLNQLNDSFNAYLNAL